VSYLISSFCAFDEPRGHSFIAQTILQCTHIFVFLCKHSTHHWGSQHRHSKLYMCFLTAFLTSHTNLLSCQQQYMRVCFSKTSSTIYPSSHCLLIKKQIWMLTVDCTLHIKANEQHPVLPGQHFPWSLMESQTSLETTTNSLYSWWFWIFSHHTCVCSYRRRVALWKEWGHWNQGDRGSKYNSPPD
jgi:hypothetical protein